MNPIWKYLFLPFVSALLISFFSVPSIIRICQLIGLVDNPDDPKWMGRKRHLNTIPHLGGVAIFCATILSLTFWSDQHLIVELQYIIFALILVFFLGVKDDLFPLTPWKKFLGQIIASIILIHIAQIRLNTFYGLFGINAIPEWLSYVLSLVVLVGITNAFNLIDGIDGLCASLAIQSSLFFGVWFYFLESTQYTILALSLAGALLGFLRFNWQPAKIFMGDTGSLLVGLIQAILAIKFIEEVRVLDRVHPFKILSVPVLTVALLYFPIFDTLRVMLSRIFKGKSPFYGDRNHIHHLFLELGFSSSKIVIILVLIQLTVILLSFFLQGIVPGELLILLITFIYIACILLVKFFIQRKSSYEHIIS